jgi:hypothetical protein
MWGLRIEVRPSPVKREKESEEMRRKEGLVLDCSGPNNLEALDSWSWSFYSSILLF